VSLASSYQNLLAEIQRISPGSSPKIIAVSKTKPYEEVRRAYLEGIRVFGENYIPEAIGKFSKLFLEFPEAKETVELHHIGPTQKGNLKKLLGFFYATHGVGSFSTAEELQKRARKAQSKIHYYLQVNLTEEDSKHGFALAELWENRSRLPELQNEFCVWLGFMGMGPSSGDPVKTREAFSLLSQFRQDFFPDKRLSMGMSGDYQTAVSYGSTDLRIGSLLFGAREKSYA